MNNYGLIFEKFNENRKALHCVEESYRIRRKFQIKKFKLLKKIIRQSSTGRFCSKFNKYWINIF